MVLKSLRKIYSWIPLTSFVLAVNGLQYFLFNFRSAYLMTQASPEFFGIFSYPTLFLIVLLGFASLAASWGIWRRKRWAFFLTIGLVVISLFRAVPTIFYIPLYIGTFILREGFSFDRLNEVFILCFNIFFEGRCLMLLVPIGLYKMRDKFSREGER